MDEAMHTDEGRPEGEAVVRLWDPLVRAIHLALIVLIAGAWWTAHNDRLDQHRLIGYAVMFLVILRVFWGFFGSEAARFRSFLVGPRKIFEYGLHLRSRQAPITIGHNPIGAVSVVLLLLMIISEVTLGLFATDVDGLESGPLSFRIDFDLSRTLAHWHGRIFYVLLGFIVLHLAAVLYYLFYKRQNLILPMVTGRKRVPSSLARSLKPASPLRAIVGAAISGALCWAIVAIGGMTP